MLNRCEKINRSIVMNIIRQKKIELNANQKCRSSEIISENGITHSDSAQFK